MTDQLTPARIGRYKTIASGVSFSIATNENGTLYLSSKETSNVFEPIDEVKDEFFEKIVAGEHNWAAIDSEGILWTCIQKNGVFNIPKRMTELEDVRKVACGKDFTLIEAPAGVLKGWGSDEYLQLGGIGSTNVPSVIEIAEMEEGEFTDLAAGSSHSLVVDSSGSIFTGGLNSRCQLGDSHMVPQGKFTELPRYLPQIKQVAAGENYSIALDVKGKVWYWGCLKHVQTPKVEDRQLPRGLANISGRCAAIAAGRHHAAVLDEEGGALVLLVNW
eukprot:CAMPEP_0206182654 /NCGR_PEP_ID=MMETSP0166-20121206/186_1 /ASSEMBLY_ACC=CAM_ASM_000260 /TAXON_ID=95228 /ORGANISM="Vannella robusta, Strain DIVA3 518/3/11/1/6" /LENGTH=273 /DNA_ID=CAMNT_0053597389 /DNA_START=18 /DNA_END=836 /DNA_ORIENTATION=+